VWRRPSIEVARQEAENGLIYLEGTRHRQPNPATRG
jgi:hypothetical protein